MDKYKSIAQYGLYVDLTFQEIKQQCLNEDEMEYSRYGCKPKFNAIHDDSHGPI